MPPRRVAVVPHTHWDREWYSPFQTFRLRLVDTLDEFLPLLERDASYRRFLLDGQMAAVDDYLAVRPEAAAVLRRLAASGRVAVGPWYALMDEFLVSGETIVRDLQLGLQRAAEYGGAMNVGYLPDMFGHIAQMPQLLRLAGMTDAVVWRGVPSAVDRAAFTWEAPDGSAVRAEYLLSGYGVGEGIGDDADELVDRVRRYEKAWEPFLVGPVLFMNGTDHQAPQPWLGRVVADANARQHDYRFEITSLAEYLAWPEVPRDGLPVWRGELRSGARANLLMGVTSNRVDVRRAAARAEQALERLAEPLCALYLPPSRWPATLLDEAWLHVVRNAAHDSVCACSADEVCDAVLHRYAEARQIGEGLASRAVDRLAASIADPGWLVVNPAARTRAVVVEIEVPGDATVPAGAQVLAERPAVLVDDVLQGDEAATLLVQLRGAQLSERSWVNRAEVRDGDSDSDGTVELELFVAPGQFEDARMDEVTADAASRLAAGGPDARLHVVIRQEPSRRLAVRVPDVPGFGWRLVGDVSVPAHPVEVTTRRGLTNGLVTIDVGPSSFAVNGVEGFARLVDGGDLGDTYNYSPPPHDTEVTAPASARWVITERGPVRGRIEWLRTYHLPDHVEEGRRVGERDVDVLTVLELHADDPMVRVSVTVDNPCRDHRLRAHFPLPRAATTSRAECAFAVVERGLDAEGGPHERALPTFPARRFVQAGALTVCHEGVVEYELVKIADGAAHELAITLLRATGMLSRNEMAYRALPAGPPVEARGAQVQGRHTTTLGVCVDPAADPYALADALVVESAVRTVTGGGDRPSTGSALAVTGAEVSAVRRVPGGTEVRVFNPTDEPTTVVITDRTGWEVDLRGDPKQPFDGSRELRPWEIATFVLGD